MKDTHLIVHFLYFCKQKNIMFPFGYLKLFMAPLMIVLGLSFCQPHPPLSDDSFVSYVVDPATQDLAFYWKDDTGAIISTFNNLKLFVESKNLTLVFAINGGMFKGDYSPKGLYIENGKQIHPIDKKKGRGNFYMKPNGVLYITDKKIPSICKTTDFKNNKHIQYATQSGPMLIINGQIHPTFKPNSKHVNIRNGVGVLPDNKLLFAISKEPVNFYDFASFFLRKGCKNALFLDGMLSEMYLPEQNWVQLDTNFGVMIGVTKPISIQTLPTNE